MIGIDEVGRGAWAGPLLVIAVRQKTILPLGLTDSKSLTSKSRAKFISDIKESCDIGEGWVSSAEIDRCGLTESMKLAVNRALQNIQARGDEQIIMDGNINYCKDVYLNVECVVKADSKFPIVSAASIYAKVSRDNLMKRLAIDYPGYGFDSHVGYGTRAHSDALTRLGITEFHRKSFKPIARFA